MVDVVVDQKPMAQLPYDPNDIPEAVRKRVAAVEALYRQPSADGDSPSPPPADALEPSPDAVAPPPQVPSEPPSPVIAQAPAETLEAPSEDPNSNTWKSRALSAQGRLEAANKDLGELQEQYYREVMAYRQQQPQQPQPQQPPPQFLTQQDVENYGNELLDVQQRAALQVVAPYLQNAQARIDAMAKENQDLRAQQQHERRRILDSQVEMAVPDYREFDRNPRWHKWLMGIDLMSGRVRQQLLNEAISAGNAPRVISFFRGFQNEEVVTGHASSSAPSPAAPPREAAINLASYASPGRARPSTGGEGSVPADKPTYTRTLIKQLYEQHRRGAYVGREAEWQRIEADMFAAQREGRVR